LRDESLRAFWDKARGARGEGKVKGAGGPWGEGGEEGTVNFS